MRNVDHLAVNTERSGSRIGLERRDDPSCQVDLGVRRRIAAIDRGDLVRMNGHPAGKAVTSRTPAVPLETLAVAKIDEHCVDSRDLRGRSREQALSAGNLVGKGPVAGFVAVGGGAERRRQILPAPGQRSKTGMCGRVGAEREHRPGGLRRDNRQLDGTKRHARPGLEGVEIAGDPLDVRRAGRLRDHQHIEARPHHRDQIIQREAGVESVDAHEERPVMLVAVVDKAGDKLASCRLARRGDGIPQGRVSARLRRTAPPFRTSARNCRERTEESAASWMIPESRRPARQSAATRPAVPVIFDTQPFSKKFDGPKGQTCPVQTPAGARSFRPAFAEKIERILLRIDFGDGVPDGSRGFTNSSGRLDRDAAAA